MNRTLASLTLLLLPLPAFAIDGPFTLVCEYGSGDFQSSKNLKIDTDAKMVDGQLANFTDSMISFDRSDDGKGCHYEINRINGDFKYDCKMVDGTSAPGFPFTGQCKKAVTKEF